MSNTVKRITIKRARYGWVWVIRDGVMEPLVSKATYLSYADAAEGAAMFLREVCDRE
jgi:hypothetical protein